MTNTEENLDRKIEAATESSKCSRWIKFLEADKISL